MIDTSQSSAYTNSSGFSALFAGARHSSKTFRQKSTNTYYWSSAPFANSLDIYAYFLVLRKSGGAFPAYTDTDFRINGISVRCLKD
ncbi:MAG: hypothetical protein V1773_04630 [bacterium]